MHEQLPSILNCEGRYIFVVVVALRFHQVLEMLMYNNSLIKLPLKACVV